MINICQLTALSTIPLSAIDKTKIPTLPPVDVSLPKEQRILQFIDDCKNPYCLRIGNNLVRMQYSMNGCGIQDCLVKSTIGKTRGMVYNQKTDIASLKKRCFPDSIRQES